MAGLNLNHMKKLLLLSLLSLISLFVACGPTGQERIKNITTRALHQVGTEVYIKPDSTKGVIFEIEPVFASSCGCGGDTSYTFMYSIRTKAGTEKIKPELIY